jgi:hypothetical protein
MSSVQSKLKVEIIDSVTPGQFYSPPTIQMLLQAKYLVASNPSPYEDKRIFAVYRDGIHTARVRTKLVDNTEQTREWVRAQVRQEQRYLLHHPHKTWFLVHRGKASLIGNISPELVPFSSLTEAFSHADRYRYLEQVMGLYLHTVGKNAHDLDGNLDSFGVANSKRLYYTEDVYRPWKDFSSLASLLDQAFSIFLWLTIDDATQLGVTVRALFDYYFHESRFAAEIVGRISLTSSGNPGQQELRQAFTQGIQPTSGEAMSSGDLTKKQPA